MKSMLSELREEIELLESKTVIITTIKKEIVIPADVNVRDFFYEKLYPLILEAQERK